MKPNNLVLLLAIYVAFIIIFNYADQGNSRIIKQVKDNRGLTSVIFIQNNDTFALDYLTPIELDSLKKVLK